MSILKWTDLALQQFAAIFAAATPEKRLLLVPVITQLEQDLIADPLSVGESRSGSIRVFIQKPLVIWFTVEEDYVRIIRVKRSK